jgi:hypothetical protein
MQQTNTATALRLRPIALDAQILFCFGALITLQNDVILAEFLHSFVIFCLSSSTNNCVISKQESAFVCDNAKV